MTIPSNAKEYQVLLVEDEETWRSQLDEYIHDVNKDIKIVAVDNVLDAKTKLRQDYFGLLVTDLGLPEKGPADKRDPQQIKFDDGRKLGSTLAELAFTLKCPCIVVTASVKHEHKTDIYNELYTDYLVRAIFDKIDLQDKPRKLRAFHEKVGEVLNSRCSAPPSSDKVVVRFDRNFQLIRIVSGSRIAYEVPEKWVRLFGLLAVNVNKADPMERTPTIDYDVLAKALSLEDQDEEDSKKLFVSPDHLKKQISFLRKEIEKAFGLPPKKSWIGSRSGQGYFLNKSILWESA